MSQQPGGPSRISITITVTDSKGTFLVGATGYLDPSATGSSGTTGRGGTVTLSVPDGTFTACASMTVYVTKTGVSISDGSATVALDSDPTIWMDNVKVGTDTYLSSYLKL